MEPKEQDECPAAFYNSATHTVASTLGVLLGISSMSHGVPEILQGNNPTHGYLINALGPGYDWTFWKHGSEPAFTLVHNFLLSGLLATAAGVLLIYWSTRCIDRRWGATVFLLASIASFLTGGGLAQCLLFTLNWAAATRIRGRLGFWRWQMPAVVRRGLAGVWRWTLLAATFFFVAALEIAMVGYFPGLPQEKVALDRILVELGAGIVGALLVSIVGGFAFDLETRVWSRRSPTAQETR